MDHFQPNTEGIMCPDPEGKWVIAEIAETRIAELETMPEGWRVHSLRLEAMERQRDRYHTAAKEVVEAYGEMEKHHEDPILAHYIGIRLHNAMEDLRALVIPGYEPKYEPSLDDGTDDSRTDTETGK